jgi:hypothetical protein
MIKKLIKKLAASLGYEIHRAQSYELAEEAGKAIIKIRPYTMLTYERLITLYQQVEFCEKNAIPGDFVECGVWKGGAVGLMALANMKYGAERRHIHLFDSFQEICEPDEAVDGQEVAERVRSKMGNISLEGKLEPLTGVYDNVGGPGTLEENQELLERTIGYEHDNLHYHVGWFQETLPTVSRELGDIAILRLDGDWYASTKICLEHLYEKVVSGGFVIIDDYGAYEGCRKAVDEFIQENNLKVYLNRVDNVCRYWIKP